MRAVHLVTVGALLASAATATAQRPAPVPPPPPPAPDAPPAPPAPRTPPAPPTMAWPEGYAFSFGDARRDRATLGVLLGEAGTDGIRVAEVAPDGPAASAGIRAGDRIVAVGDASLRLDAGDVEDPLLRMTAERRLRRALDRMSAGDEVTLRIARDGSERAIRVRTVRADALEDATPGAQWTPAPRLAAPRPPREPREPRPARVPAAPRAPRGADAPGDVTLYRATPAPRADRATLGLTLGGTASARDTLGVFVAAVAPDGPAERAGIHEGMRIAAIGGVDLRAGRGAGERARAAEQSARLERELSRVEPGDAVTLRVWDGDRAREMRVRTARGSDVWRDGAGAWAPGTTVRVVPRGSTTIVPRVAPRELRELRVMPRELRELRELQNLRITPSPDARVEILDWDDLSPEERARIERRMDEARVRMEEARDRMTLSREQMQAMREQIESSQGQMELVRDRLEATREAREAGVAAAERALRATRALTWPRRWMD